MAFVVRVREKDGTAAGSAAEFLTIVCGMFGGSRLAFADPDALHKFTPNYDFDGAETLARALEGVSRDSVGYYHMRTL